jgi:hypothetical protein
VVLSEYVLAGRKKLLLCERAYFLKNGEEITGLFQETPGELQPDK